MSFFTRSRRLPDQGRTTAEDDLTADDRPEAAPGGETPAGEGGSADGDSAGARRRKHPVAARVVTALAFLFVLFALIAPNDIAGFTPGAIVRIPVEGLIGVALVLALPPRAGRVVAVLAGVALGLLTILKIIDMGYYATLARPFDPMLDWTFFSAGEEFLSTSVGRAGAIVTVVAVVLLIVAVLVLMTRSVLRLSRLVVRHDTAAARTVAVLGVAWVACALLGAEIVPGLPVAADGAAALAYDHADQVRADLRDREAFARESAVDAFRDTPSKDLLTGLRGKDVVLSFVESYGRDAIEDPNFATQVGAVLDDGTRRLRAAGFSSRSAFLTSPTSGGGSWLAHGTLLSGLWIDNQQRYDKLIKSDRLTLDGAFQRASWRTVAVMPGNTRDWPEAKFYGQDKIYDARNLGYRGAPFNWGTPPDQYTLAAFHRAERAAPGHAPVMAEIPLVSSHSPWAPTPRLIGWNDVGDGTAFNPIAAAGQRPDVVWRDPSRVRAAYRVSIEYTLSSLISYVETYGGKDLVLVFLGDHQPLPLVTGRGASRDVPITIVAHDQAVLDRISGWGWQDGLKPGPQAPVWRMNAFRDRFLTAFGPQATPPPAHPAR